MTEGAETPEERLERAERRAYHEGFSAGLREHAPETARWRRAYERTYALLGELSGMDTAAQRLERLDEIVRAWVGRA